MFTNPAYRSSNIPKTLREIESLDVDDDEDDNTSIYSHISNISELTTPSSIRTKNIQQNNYNLRFNTIQESVYEDPYYNNNNNEEYYDEEEEEDIVLDESNPEFVGFKNDVKIWLLLDDEIKTLQKAINDRKKRKNELTPKVLEFMGKYEIDDLNTNEGKIQYTKTLITKPMNKEYMKTRLSEFLKSVEKAEKATKYLFENRPKEEKIRLKRVNVKPS